MSVRQGDAVIAGGSPIKIDSSLNPLSVNPIQNKAVANKFGLVDTAIETINNTKQDNIIAGNGIVIDEATVAVGNLDCGTMS